MIFFVLIGTIGNEVELVVAIVASPWFESGLLPTCVMAEVALVLELPFLPKCLGMKAICSL
jgi:hypothetical protein